MTTVAYSAGVMACDSCWTHTDVVDTLTTKITRLSSGALFGGAGQNDGRAILALFDKVKTPGQMPSYEALMAIRAASLGLLVLPKGRIYKIATTIVSPDNWTDEMEDFGMWEIDGSFAAIGSGGHMALVAMDCGKSARDAVRIACRYDPYSRPPVHVVPLSTVKA